MAVRYDIGLKRPEIHRTAGVSMCSAQSQSCLTLASSSVNHSLRSFFVGFVCKAHLGGRALISIEAWRISIDSEMFRAPSRPQVSSTREKRISPKRVFIFSHSQMQTIKKGVFTSILSWRSIMLKSAGSSFRKEAIFALVPASLLAPLEEPPETERIVAKRVSPTAVR